MDCRSALQTVLDQVDYTAGACTVTEMVGAVLPKEVIRLARQAIQEEPESYSVARAARKYLKKQHEPLCRKRRYSDGPERVCTCGRDALAAALGETNK